MVDLSKLTSNKKISSKVDENDRIYIFMPISTFILINLYVLSTGSG